MKDQDGDPYHDGEPPVAAFAVDMLCSQGHIEEDQPLCAGCLVDTFKDQLQCDTCGGIQVLLKASRY